MTDNCVTFQERGAAIRRAPLLGFRSQSRFSQVDWLRQTSASKLSAPAAVAPAAGAGMDAAAALSGAVVFRAAGFGHITV